MPNDVPEMYYRDFQDYYQGALGRILDPETRMLKIEMSVYRTLQDAFAAGTRARREQPVEPSRDALMFAERHGPQVAAGKTVRVKLPGDIGTPFQGAQDLSFEMQEVRPPAPQPFEHTGTVWQYREPGVPGGHPDPENRRHAEAWGAPGPVPTPVQDDWPSGPMQALAEDELGDDTQAWLRGLRDVHTAEEDGGRAGGRRDDRRRSRYGQPPPHAIGPRPVPGGRPDRRGDDVVRHNRLRDSFYGPGDAPSGQPTTPPYIP